MEFVRAKSREFWAWDLLGDLLEDRGASLACYAKALTCPSDDAFTGQVRLKFAEGISGQHPGEARTEIDRVIEASRAAGHRVPAKAEELMHRGWYIQAEPVQIAAAFYSRWSKHADDFLLAQLPKRLAVIDHVNHERKLFHFIVEKGVDGVAPFTSFGKAPIQGQVLLVRVDTTTGTDGARTSLFSIEKTEEPMPSHLGVNFCGEVRVSNGMGFTSDNIFIPAAMIAASGIDDADVVDGTAVISFDKRKQRWGLKAIRTKRAFD